MAKTPLSWIEKALGQPAPAHAFPPPVAAPITFAEPSTMICRQCGEYDTPNQQRLCKKCRLQALIEAAPKRHPSAWPCAVCGCTHSEAWSMDGFTVNKRPTQVPVCQDCRAIMDRNFGPDLGRELSESWLDQRAGELLGVAVPWRPNRRGQSDVLHGLVRHLQRVGPDMRPQMAHELPSYGPTSEVKQPLHYLPLAANRAAHYRRNFGRLRVLQSYHEDLPRWREDGSTVDQSRAATEMLTVKWARWIQSFAQQNGLSYEDAAQQVTVQDGTEMAVRPSPKLAAAALAYLQSGKRL